MVPIIIIGGTGVFGRFIVEELQKSEVDFQITVAARRKSEFMKYFKSEEDLKFQHIDLKDESSIKKALQGKFLCIMAAGPFQGFSNDLVSIAAKEGVHYLDICDDPGYIEKIHAVKPALDTSQKIFITGLSSLPGISLPLAALIYERFDHVNSIDIGLFIGNNNQKGRGAVFSALDNLNQEVTVYKQGLKHKIPGWSHKQAFAFPEPIGKVPGYSFSSADPMLFAKHFQFNSLNVKVAFEWAIARWSFSWFKFLAGLGLHKFVKAMVSVMFPLFALAHNIGSERGAVTVTIKGENQKITKAFSVSIYADKKSQRMASLPCVIAAEAIAKNECSKTGLLALHEWMEPKTFFAKLEEKGMQLIIEEL